jgi:hypothetical protein
VTDDLVQGVVDTLHERSDICAGADTCEARGAIAPLVNELERLQALENDDWRARYSTVSHEVEQMRAAWEKDNLCGVCPYRQALQVTLEQLRMECNQARADAERMHRERNLAQEAQRHATDLAEEATDLAERYADAIEAISAALHGPAPVNRALIVIAGLDTSRVG